MSKKQKHTKKEKEIGKQVEELKTQLARSLADYDNFRKRVERDKEELESLVKAKLILKLLPVFDMLYDAQGHLNDSGLALTIKELEETLKQEGIVKIKSEIGDSFDENLHEAVDVVKNEDLENNQIADVALRGWKFEDPPEGEASGPVIRHAKVIVNKI